jgi:NADH-quinone oxidoreductase subunit G
LPLATIFESPGTFINIEGQWQSFVQACKPHYNSKEGWKILTKLRSIFGANIENSLDYIDILNEVDSAVRDYKSFANIQYKEISIKDSSHNGSLIRSGGSSSYFIDNVVRRASSLNKVNESKNSISVNRKTLEENNIDASKNKVLVKQGENSLLAELVIDENVSDGCVHIINSNKEHYELGKQFEPIIIENV